MRRALLPLLLAAVAARADDAEVAKGLQNLEKIYAITHIMEARLAAGVKPEFGGEHPMRDPWGTVYRVDVDAYRIVSAGSDQKFDEASWATSEQFTGYEGDVVFENGTWVRTNHNWLCRQVTPGGEAASVLARVRHAEFVFMSMRTEPMRTTLAPRMTQKGIEAVAAVVEAYRAEHKSLSGLTLDTVASRSPLRVERDAWGTRLRLEIDGDTYRIVSAGADRTFDPESWSRAAALDPAEDIVFENGAFLRRFDEEKYAKSKGVPTADPVRQPRDPRLPGTPVGALLKDANVKPPTITQRVEPVYPESYRKLRISGIVILEASISDTGTIGDIAVLKSIGPAIDMAAVEAVRQWTFTPATVDGKPVPVLFNLTINFKLN